jgi:hypothetical protein
VVDVQQPSHRAQVIGDRRLARQGTQRLQLDLGRRLVALLVATDNALGGIGIAVGEGGQGVIHLDLDQATASSHSPLSRRRRKSKRELPEQRARKPCSWPAKARTGQPPGGLRHHVRPADHQRVHPPGSADHHDPDRSEEGRCGIPMGLARRGFEMRLGREAPSLLSCLCCFVYPAPAAHQPLGR